MKYRIPKFSGYNDLLDTVDNVLLNVNEMPYANNVDFTKMFGSVTREWGEKEIGSDSVVSPLNGPVTLIEEGDVYTTESLNKRFVVAGTTLYLYCIGEYFVPIDTPFTSGNYIDFARYHNSTVDSSVAGSAFYFADGVNDVQTWDGYSFGTDDLVVEDDWGGIIDDDASQDNTDDWSTTGTAAIVFKADHYALSSSAISDTMYNNNDLTDYLSLHTSISLEIDIKDGTHAGGKIDFGFIGADKAKVHGDELTSTSAWVTHTVSITTITTDMYVGLIAKADWSGENIEVRNIKMTSYSDYVGKHVAIFKNRLWMFDLTESGTNYPSRARRSIQGNPSLWNISHSFNIGEPTEKIIRAIPLYDNLVVFKENSVHLVLNVGSESGGLPFSAHVIDEKVQNIALWSIKKTQNGIIFLAEEGMFITNGQSVDALEDSIKIDGILKRIYIDHIDKCYASSSDLFHQYWLTLPLDGSTTCNFIVVYDWKYRTWKVIEKDTTCIGFFTADNTGTWNSISDLTWNEVQNLTWNSSDLYGGSKYAVYGGTDGKVKKRFPGFNNDDVAFTSELETGWMDCGDPNMVKDFTKIIPRWNGTNGESVTVQYKVDYETTWEPCINEDLSVTDTQPQIDIHSSGTFIKFRFKMSTINANFTIHEATIVYEDRGDR